MHPRLSNKKHLIAVLILIVLNFISSAEALAQVETENKGTGLRTFSGNSSWYGPGFHGKKTANGETFNMNHLTAAHLKLSFGTKVLVENPKNGKSTIVRINDRGPYHKSRILDVSRAGARELGMLTGGTAFVECTVLPK